MQVANAGPSDHAGQSSSAEMRQKNITNALNPFVARPATYYGDGPFDPPSSDDEAEGSRHSFEDDAESVLLLNLDKSGPSSPGTAERGGQSPHRTKADEKVRQFNGVHGDLLFLTLILVYLCNVLITEVLPSPHSCSRAHFSGCSRRIYWHSCWLYIFWKILLYTRNAKDHYGPYV